MTMILAGAWNTDCAENRLRKNMLRRLLAEKTVDITVPTQSNQDRQAETAVQTKTDIFTETEQACNRNCQNYMYSLAYTNTLFKFKGCSVKKQ